LVTVSIWRVIQKIVRVKKDKVPGKTFEYLFFFFLFVASYALTFMVYFLDKPEKIIDYIFMNYLFVPTLISAAYCGWFHYIEGISSENYLKPKTKKKLRKK
jgi:hypothetical protein